jgi:hypothetical protein
VLLVVIQTNLGPRLQRHDSVSGKPLWKGIPLLDPGPLHPSDCDMDTKMIYLARGRKLVALSLVDGKIRWETTLRGPEGTWRVRRWGDYLLAYPRAVTEWQIRFRSPWGAVQWAIGLPPEERPGSSCPILALDAATGKLVQCWNFPAGGLRMRSKPADPSSWFTMEVVRGLEDAGMNVIAVPNGLVVALGGQVWGLRPRD